MLNITRLWPVLTVILSGCATSVPVAVPCPVSPPIPQILQRPALTERNLNEQYQDLWKELQRSLGEASKQ